MTGPLTGIRVLDLSRVVMGRPVDVDLTSPEGRAAVHGIAATCDVVVATMRPQVLERLGLDYATIRGIRPDVVYCQAQGHPLDSGRAHEPAYDDVVQAATGVCDVTARVSGTAGLFPSIVADKVCGLVMAQAVTAALLHRERTGEGQHVEVAMVPAMSAFMLAEHGSGAIAEPPLADPGKPAAGYPRILTPERRPHPTRDGLVHMFPYRPVHYATLFAAAGYPDAADDPRYVDQRATIANAESLYRDVRTVCATRTTQEWLDFCAATGIPATRVASLQDLVDELPLAEHPAAGRYRVIPPMARFSATPAAVRRPAPLIGEHTAEVLAEIAPVVRTDPARTPARTADPPEGTAP